MYWSFIYFCKWNFLMGHWEDSRVFCIEYKCARNAMLAAKNFTAQKGYLQWYST